MRKNLDELRQFILDFMNKSKCDFDVEDAEWLERLMVTSPAAALARIRPHAM